tara:strand:+ start:439 stop:588 length:150 start_codon:yes stop_codon:yes gene_type:complete
MNKTKEYNKKKKLSGLKSNRNAHPTRKTESLGQFINRIGKSIGIKRGGE